jgi:ABC-type branched-subunit amino acid transport system ATPase component/predicted MFS family arabinose efflux permease
VADLSGLATTLLDEEHRRLTGQVANHDSRDAAEASELASNPPSISLREGLRLGGASTFVVLILLSSLDELESAALAILAPDIARTFHISDGMIVFLSAAAGAFIVLGAIPMGWLADRYRRGPIIGIASLIFGLTVFMSGLAVNAFAFFVARFTSGIAKSNAGPVQGSLLADTYPISVRGRVGAAFGVAGRLFAVSSPLLVGAIAGAAGGADGWRWAYYLLGLPVLLFAGAAFFLPEPIRGRWEKAAVLDDVVDDSQPAPVSVEAAFARLRSIRTLRTVIVAFAAMGFGLFTAPVLANMFLVRQYGLDTLQRGLVATIGGIAGLLVIPFVGRYYDSRFRRDPAKALRFIGYLTLPSALLVPVQYFMPNAVLFTIAGIPQVVLLSSAFAMVGPLLLTVVPYRLRGLGAAMGSIYVFFFGATGGALVALPLTNAYGPRTTLILMLVPATILGGALIIRSASYIRGDLAMVVEEIREEYDDHQQRRADPDNVPVIQVHAIDVAYGNVQVLFDVAFEVGRGEVLALLGTNGAGKSTILRAIAGLITPTRGVIRFNGRTITYASPEQRVGMGIVSLAGGDGVFPSMTVGQNLATATFVYRREPDGGTARIERVLRLFPALAERRNVAAGSLSGGQQQMLALALALVHDPEVLLIDELSLGLAPAVVSELLDVVEALRAQGLAMVIVEQSINVAISLADRAVFLEKGHVRFSGPAAELAERGDLVRAVFLGTEGG